MQIGSGSGTVEFGVRITIDNDVFVNGVKASREELDKLSHGIKVVAQEQQGAARSQESLTGAVLKGNLALEAGRMAGDALVNMYQAMRDATRELQQDQVRLDAILNATGRTAELHSGRVQAFAENLAKKTALDDNVIMRANTQLLTYANLTQTTIERVIKAAADLTAARGGELVANAEMIAKAMTETGSSFQVIERKLGDLDNETAKHIRTLREQGDVMGANDALLNVIEGKVGGTAVEAYRGLERQIGGTKKAWDDLLKAMGKTIFDDKNREAGFLETTMRVLTDKLNDQRSAWQKLNEVMATTFSVWKGGPLGAMFANRGALDAAGERSTQVDTSKDFADRVAAKRAEAAREAEAGADAARKTWDDILGRLDKAVALESEINRIKAAGLAAGKDELEVQRAIALVREKYMHGQRDAAREAERQRREAAREVERQRREAEREEERERKLRIADQVAELDAEKKRRDEITKIQGLMAEIVEDSRLELELVGKSTLERTLARKELEARQRLEREIAKYSEEEKAKLRAQLETSLALARVNANIVDEKRKIAAITGEIAKAEAEALTGLVGGYTNFIADFLQNGRSAIGRLKGDIRSLLADMFKLASTRWGMTIVGQLSGNSTLVQGASALGAGSTASNAISMVGSAASYLGAASGFTSSSAYVGMQGGYIAQSAYLAGGAETVATSGTVWGSIGEGIATIAQAIPVWGWILLAILALVAIFSKPGGGDKEGGSFGGTFDSSGAFIGDATIPGTDNGRFFTPSSMDPAMRRAGTQIAGSYFDALTRLGGRSGGNVTFGLGIDTDPRGDAQSRWSSLVQVGGRTMYDVRDRSVGRDEGDMEKEFADQIPRMILAALQGSDWSQIAGVGNILSTVNAETATQEAIKAVIDLADAFSVMRGAMAAIDLDKFIGDLHKGPNDRFRDMGKALSELSGKTRITVADMQRLGQSTIEYKNAVAQLLAGFESAKTEISAMFADTMRSIRMNNMNDTQRYAFLQGEADTLLSQIQGSTNADEIRNYAARINQNINEAFALLSPEEQRAREQDYLTRIERANQITRERLAEVQRETATEANRILNEIKAALDLKAEQFGRAADTQLAAATMNRDNPVRVDIDVEVFDTRSTATVVNGA